MAIPAYLWLKDDGGAAIKGSGQVLGREGSIEIQSFSHALHIPADGSTGRLMSTRVHAQMKILLKTVMIIVLALFIQK